MYHFSNIVSHFEKLNGGHIKVFYTKLFYGTAIVQNYHMLASVQYIL